jgi:hypothetical protein
MLYYNKYLYICKRVNDIIHSNIYIIIKKRTYVSPSVEIIPMEEQRVIAASGEPKGGLEDFGPGSDIFSAPASTRKSYAAGSSDLESMINDILTVGQ